MAALILGSGTGIASRQSISRDVWSETTELGCVSLVKYALLVEI